MQQLNKKPTLLMVDDDDEDIYLTRRAFTQSGKDLTFTSVHSGTEMFDYLYGRAQFEDKLVCPQPDIVLLDINIPKESGFEILRRLRSDEKFGVLPVIMLTTSSAAHDIHQAYHLGANSYMCKSVSVKEMQCVAEQFCSYWFERAKLPSAA